MAREGLAHLSGFRGRNRAHVDADQAFSGGLDHAAGPEQHGLHIGRVRHAGDDDVAGLRRVPRSVGPEGAFLEQGLGFGFRAAVHGDRVARAEQVPGHGLAHDAGADETDPLLVHSLHASNVRRGHRFQDGGRRVGAALKWDLIDRIDPTDNGVNKVNQVLFVPRRAGAAGGTADVTLAGSDDFQPAKDRLGPAGAANLRHDQQQQDDNPQTGETQVVEDHVRHAARPWCRSSGAVRRPRRRLRPRSSRRAAARG